jgi:uncharacterized protein (DUF1697 family)
MTRVTRVVVLLRGVNVGGRRPVPMAELRQLALDSGFADVATYIQSGNLVLTTAASPAVVEATLERALEARFGFAVDVVARTAAAWARDLEDAPFPDAARARPSHLLLGLAKGPPAPGAAAALAARATLGERVAVRGDAVWVDYAGGVGRSKLDPAALARAVGGPVTARSWTTVLKLAELAGPVSPGGRDSPARSAPSARSRAARRRR